MNILVISNLFPPYTLGGYEVACQEFTSGFKGDRITVLTSHYGLPRPTIDGDVARVLPNVFGSWPEGALSLPQGWRRYFTPKVFGLCREWIKKTNPDVCYLWNCSGLSLAPVLACRSTRTPVVYHFEDYWLVETLFHPSRSLQRARHALARPFVLSRHTGAVFVSDFLRGSYATSGLEFSRSAVVHNGIRPRTFPAKSYVPSDSPLQLLFVGRIVPDKGLDVLLEAMALARGENRISLKLDVAGAGPDFYVDRLRGQAARLNVCVSWLGRVRREQLADVYAKHDVFVIPSLWEEPFGLVALEAMAVGLPVVATASGGLAEIVRPGINGYLVAPGDPKELSRALVRFAEDRSLIQKLGAEAAKDVRRRFDLGTATTSARAFLDEIAAGG